MDFSAKYHFRGQRPGTCANEKPTKLARYIENESSLSLADKYCDLYIVRDETLKGKRQPILHFLVSNTVRRCKCLLSVLLRYVTNLGNAATAQTGGV